MNQGFIKYLKALAFFSLAAALIYFLLNYFTLGTPLHLPKPWALFVFVVVLSALFHYGLLAYGSQDNRSFVRYYMSASTFKILIYVLVIVIVAIAKKELIKPFAVNFFVLYILFTVFEVFYLQKMYLTKK